ncbi:hypothetical protein PoB_006764100 [Plakobranchus ocellatus]|uniref:Laminin EGF-like domain-containing protein n=1 Tax=Plakobranchus ocellatus TaxID=259542 RepID=A0AAV4DAQ1_9GAST|nr:hypothetical protein PoB_006764100 [Plakobranchus ocellatus]
MPHMLRCPVVVNTKLLILFSSCQSGYFGDQCKQACSPNCHDETGYCNLCPPGKTGDYCDIGSYQLMGKMKALKIYHVYAQTTRVYD